MNDIERDVFVFLNRSSGEERLAIIGIMKENTKFSARLFQPFAAKILSLGNQNR